MTVNQYCILKADDFGEINPAKKEWANYVKFFDLVQEKRICAGIGVIGNQVEDPSKNFVTFVQKMDKTGRFEFWNHGYDHGYDAKDAEFQGKSYAYQYKKMTDAQDVMKRYFGITMHTFGAAGNHIDVTTAQVIANIPEMKVWLYNGKIPAPNGKLGIPEGTDIEWRAKDSRRIDSERFKKSYNPNAKVLLCQMHPLCFGSEDFSEFEKFVDFLLGKDVEFILPYEYYKLLQKKQNV